MFLALTVLVDLKPLQIDVDLAYLYANLEEPVYLRPPDGLPQSEKNWHELIKSILLSDKIELKQMLTDTCLFVRRKSDGKIIFYVYM